MKNIWRGPPEPTGWAPGPLGLLGGPSGGVWGGLGFFLLFFIYKKYIIYKYIYYIIYIFIYYI